MKLKDIVQGLADCGLKFVEMEVHPGFDTILCITDGPKMVISRDQGVEIFAFAEDQTTQPVIGGTIPYAFMAFKHQRGPAGARK